eukprot:6212315-Pleurochrysis_carterae.AAC.1
MRAVESLAAARVKVAKTKSAAEQHRFLREQVEIVRARSGTVRARHLVIIGGHAALERGALHGARQSAQGEGATASRRRVADGDGAAAYEAKDV